VCLCRALEGDWRDLPFVFGVQWCLEVDERGSLAVKWCWVAVHDDPAPDNNLLLLAAVSW
jgi:hypothetical protein